MAATSLNKGNKNALTVKLDQVYKLVDKGENDGALEVLNGLVAQIGEFQSAGKLTADEAAELLRVANQLISNLGYWQ